MCLAVLGKILELSENNAAVVDVAGNSKVIDICLVPGVVRGDYVLIHSGFAIEKINEKEALEIVRLRKGDYSGYDVN